MTRRHQSCGADAASRFGRPGADPPAADRRPCETRKAVIASWETPRILRPRAAVHASEEAKDGRRRLATLFVDLAGSTGSVVRHPPETVPGVVQGFAGLGTDIALAHRGRVKDFEKDGALLLRVGGGRRRDRPRDPGGARPRAVRGGRPRGSLPSRHPRGPRPGTGPAVSPPGPGGGAGDLGGAQHDARRRTERGPPGDARVSAEVPARAPPGPWTAAGEARAPRGERRAEGPRGPLLRRLSASPRCLAACRTLALRHA